MVPSETSPETCSELVYLTCGGESGQHMAGIVAPLLIHDLPVTRLVARRAAFRRARRRSCCDGR